MPAYLTAVFAAAFAGMFIGWSVLERRKSSPRLWLGLAATAIALPIAYFAGAFSTSFSDNLCYSEAIAELQAAQKAGRQVSLTLHGYETNCAELLAGLKQR
ncbi:MAG: hypothetical protein U1E72_12360 [Burkholderiaceae bacterium]